jgi:hypothetical protein
MPLELKTCTSGFLAIRLHYSIDPELWPPSRIAAIRAAIPGWRWNKEYEIDFSARGGRKVYECFDPIIHTLAAPPFDLAECLCYKAIDHGRRNPTACLWFAEHKPSNTVYFYREYYRPDATIAEHCRSILALEKKHETRLALIDPSTHRRLDNAATTIADEYARHGLPCIPADNNLTAGIETVTSALVSSLARWSLAHNQPHIWFTQRSISNEALNDLADTQAVYFHPSLTNTLRELSQLSWDTTADDVSDKALCEQITQVDDHAADCVRYALRRPYARVPTIRTNLKKI